jgi:hypothetical protein
VIGLIQCVSYPVAHHPARAAIYDLLLQLNGGRGIPGFRTAETLVFYSATLAVALTVTDLGERGAWVQLAPPFPCLALAAGQITARLSFRGCTALRKSAVMRTTPFPGPTKMQHSN